MGTQTCLNLSIFRNSVLINWGCLTLVVLPGLTEAAGLDYNTLQQCSPFKERAEQNAEIHLHHTATYWYLWSKSYYPFTWNWIHSPLRFKETFLASLAARCGLCCLQNYHCHRESTRSTNGIVSLFLFIRDNVVKAFQSYKNQGEAQIPNPWTKVVYE